MQTQPLIRLFFGTSLSLTRVWFRHAMRYPAVQNAGKERFAASLEAAGFGQIVLIEGHQRFRPSPTYRTNALEIFAEKYVRAV